eukprot:COSAG02_NODE_52413_length_308_cov_0.602871_2_plen_33_part_01
MKAASAAEPYRYGSARCCASDQTSLCYGAMSEN